MRFRSALMFDLRSAPFGTRHEQLYPAALDAVYAEECRKLGRAPGPIFGRSVGTHCTEDVDKVRASRMRSRS